MLMCRSLLKIFVNLTFPWIVSTELHLVKHLLNQVCKRLIMLHSYQTYLICKLIIFVSSLTIIFYFREYFQKFLKNYWGLVKEQKQI